MYGRSLYWEDCHLYSHTSLKIPEDIAIQIGNIGYFRVGPSGLYNSHPYDLCDFGIIYGVDVL